MHTYILTQASCVQLSCCPGNQLSTIHNSAIQLCADFVRTMANVVDTISRGVPIVTDLQFWKEDRAWEAIRSYLEQQRALLIEGVNVFDVAGT